VTRAQKTRESRGDQRDRDLDKRDRDGAGRYHPRGGPTKRPRRQKGSHTRTPEPLLRGKALTQGAREPGTLLVRVLAPDRDLEAHASRRAKGQAGARRRAYSWSACSASYMSVWCVMASTRAGPTRSRTILTNLRPGSSAHIVGGGRGRPPRPFIRCIGVRARAYNLHVKGGRLQMICRPLSGSNALAIAGTVEMCRRRRDAA
jgi:hypothetical protein